MTTLLPALLGAMILAGLVADGVTEVGEVHHIDRGYVRFEEQLRALGPVRWLVVGAEPVTSVDVTAADILEELDQSLRDAGIDLCFAEMKDPVKDKLKRFGLFARLGEPRFFATLGEAVGRYVATHQVQWRDWEDSRG